MLYQCWITEHSIISLNGFNAHAYHRTKRVRNRTQREGIVILVKDKLEQYVKINEILFYTIVWIQISKDIFHDQNDMFIAAVYIPPIHSKFHDIYDCDLFLELSNCIAKYT